MPAGTTRNVTAQVTEEDIKAGEPFAADARTRLCHHLGIHKDQADTDIAARVTHALRAGPAQQARKTRTLPTRTRLGTRTRRDLNHDLSRQACFPPRSPSRPDGTTPRPATPRHSSPTGNPSGQGPGGRPATGNTPAGPAGKERR